MSTTMPPTPEPAEPRASDPTIGRLVADATENFSGIIRNEIALAKAEISVDAKKAGKGAAMFAGAAVMGVFGLIFLLHTIALGLFQLGLQLWLSYLIVTLVLFVIAGILAMIGKGAISKVKGKPTRTIDSTKLSIDAVKRGAAGDETRAIRLADPTTHGATQRTNPAGAPVPAVTPASAPTTHGATQVEKA